MAYSPASYTTDGITTDYDVTFSYITKSHVKATVSSSPVTFTWLTSSRIRLDSVPTAGKPLVIYRETDIDAPEVVLQPTQTPYADTLNTALQQTLYALQEEAYAAVLASDYAADALASKNAASTSETNAAASASAAATSATNAATSATNSANSATAAAGSATTASTQATNAAAGATTAANEATAAATSESNAATSATNAATSATNAANSATAAAASATAAAASETACADSEAAINQALNGYVFEWDSGTADSDPGAGNLRGNNAALASVTQLFVSETDDVGAAVADVLATWDDSTSATRAFVTLRKRAAPLNFAMFAISGAQTDGGTYRKFPVGYIGHQGSFSDGDALTVIIERTGDQGAPGPGSGDLLAANNLSELAATAATARGNIATAPNSAEYFVGTLNSELTGERAATATATIEWDLTVGGQFKANVVAGSIGATQLGSDAVTTVKILNNNVTLAKIQQIATDRLLGRDTTGTGDVEQLTVGGGLEFSGVGGIQRSALTGDVTASAGSNATTIASSAVTTAKIAADAVTYAKIQNVSATDRLLGRDTAAAGDIEELTVGGGLEFTGSGGIRRSALTGPVTASAGSNTTALASAILNAMAANSGITGTITVSTSAPSGGADGDIWLERAV